MMLKTHGRIYNLASWGFMENKTDDTVRVTVPGVSVDLHVTGVAFMSADIVADIIRDGAGLVLTWDEFETAYHEEAERARRRAQVAEMMRAGL